MRRFSRIAVAALMVTGYMGSQAAASAHTATTPTGPLPTASIGDVSVVEGDTGSVNVSVPVSISAPTTKAVSVAYSVESGTATAGLDFTAKTGSVSIKIGATSASIVVKVLGDVIAESDETVIVRITSVKNAVVGSDTSGSITIKDNDASKGPVPAVSVGDVSVVEGDAGTLPVTIPVDLSRPALATTTLQYSITALPGSSPDDATAGTDFVAASGKLTIKAGADTSTITATVDSDTAVEPDQSFAVDVTSATNAQVGDESDGTVTIIDDDADNATVDPSTEQVSIGDLSVVKPDTGAAQTAYMPVTLSRPAPARIVVDFFAQCDDPTGIFTGADTGKITFSAGQRSKTLPISVASDQTADGATTFVRSIAVEGNTATTDNAQGVGTIVDPNGGLPVLPVHGVELESVNSKDVLAKEPVGGVCSPLGHFGSFNPSVSADASKVAFVSDATNLVPHDDNAEWDVFVRDRVSGTTVRASVASDGSESPAAGPTGPAYIGADSPVISANGRYVSVYENQPLGSVSVGGQLYVHDLVTGQTDDVSVAPDGSPVSGVVDWPSTMSADGRYITFWACSPNNGSDLVSPNPDPSTPDVATTDHNGDCDVFVRDLVTHTTSLVSQSMDGAGADGSFPIISGNGQFVSFVAASGHLVAGDTNGCEDDFVRNLSTGTTERVNLSSSGAQSVQAFGECPPIVQGAALSYDGRYVTFASADTSLVGTPVTADFWLGAGIHTFLHDRVTGTTTQVDSPGTHFTYYSAISDDGRYVSYTSASGCDPNTGVVYVKDLTTGITREVGVLPDGTLPDGNQTTQFATAVMSSDAAYIVFSTDADNLVHGDHNQASDVFVQRLH